MKERIFNLLFRASVWAALFFSGLLIGGTTQGEIIPANRRITWQGNVGVPGGIPNRTTIFANVRNAPYNAKGDGVTDDTAAIQSALNACPAGQVVYIPTGNYRVSGILQLKGSYTVRGDGQGLTIINGYVPNNNEVFALGAAGSGGMGDFYYWYPTGSAINVTAGTSLGSSNITVTSIGAGVTNGALINIDEINDTRNLTVSSIGNEGQVPVPGSCWCRDGNHMLGQIVRITGISGNNLSIDPPLVWWFTNSAQIVPITCYNTYAGVENLTVYNNNTGGGAVFSMLGCAYCWVKNVESAWADGDHFIIDSSARCEVRDSYIHDGYSHVAGTHDDTLKLQGHSSGILVENNIFRRLHTGTILVSGGSGSVIAYNFYTNQFASDALPWLYDDITFHGAHAMMVLTEGNVMNRYDQDGIWGTGSHGTLLRNYITGQDWICPPFTGRGPEQTNSFQQQYAGNVSVMLAGIGVSMYFNVVGNVLGTPGMGNAGPTIYMTYPPTVRANNAQGYVWNLGYGGLGDYGSLGPGDNATPFTTLINHGNWDVVSGTQLWSNNISDHVIPQSYYLSGKPVFFGNMTWPPVDPSHGATNLAQAIIPAQYRYFYGTTPPAGPINQPPIANVSATPTNGPAPLAVSFSSAGSYDPEGVALSYAWTFGDGTTSTAANPSHTYQNPGSYNAQLRVSDGTSTTTSSLITINLTIAGTNQPPVAVASATPMAGPAPLLVTFSSAGSYDPEGTTLSYNWTFGDGSASTAANPSHTYAGGTFSAQLRVSDGTNSTSSNPMTITVTNPAPIVSMTSPTNGASYTAPATINLAASITPNGHTITKVQFYNGTTLLGEDTAAPYTLSLTNVRPATYSLVAQAVYDAGATTASSAVTVTVGGLVAAYGFDEGSGTTTADASANRNNGTVSNATWTTAGQYGSALSFNGSNSLVTVSDSASLDLTQCLTLEAWVFPTALGGWRPILFKPLGTQLGYVLQGSSNPSGVPSLGLSVAPSNVMAPNPLPLNTWSHVAGTYNGMTMALYVNGVQVASQSQTGTLATSTDALTIGGDTMGELWSGLIDEVRIYNRALSASEIQADMNTPVDAPPPPPTGLHVVGP